MKNFNQFILTLLAAGLLASCSLTEEPTSFVNRKSFYKNESQCIAALNSCYMPANAIYTANFMLVTEACTDIWYSSSTTVDACLDVTPAKPQYGKNVWTQGYKGVMYCNECVECISSADLADGVKMPLAAEARVMRAFYYYVLTCMFGGRRGTVTDSNGRYSLTLGAGDALISVSYLGYVTRQIVIGDRTEVDVNLVPDAKNTINEVVVIGYGAVKKSDLTGSVSNVKMSDIRDVPNTSVDQALQGRIAGVDIMSTSVSYTHLTLPTTSRV